MEDNIIYHYTTIEALSKIIVDTTDSQKGICLLATDFEFLNDPTEIYHGFEVLCKYLHQVENELDIPKEMQVADDVCSGLHNIKDKSIYKDYGYGSYVSIYLTCFSENKDSLPMWNMYAGNGNGISLGFDWGPIWFSPEHVKKVIYDNDINQIIETLKTYYSHVKINEHKSDITQVISALFRYIGMRIKHNKYSYENEWRLSLSAATIEKQKDGINKKVKFRVSDNKLLPYHEVFFPSFTLKKIIVGPTRNFEQTKKAINMFLNTRGLNHVEIIKSEVPYIR